MTAPSYTSDLTTYADGTGETWTEAGSSWSNVFAITDGETDAYIQGDACTSCTVKTGIGVLLAPTASVTIPANGAFLVWMKWDAPNSLEPYANGGLRSCIGTSTTALYSFDQDGGDTYTYGGWKNYAAGDPNDAAVTADETLGTPGTSWTYLGGGFNATSVPSKGNPFQVDAIRYGRCTVEAVNGDGTSGYATFDGLATENDEANNRWGLFQAVPGGYSWKGQLNFGNSTNIVDFRDSNKAITVEDTPKTTTYFNRVEVSNTTSNVFLTAISFTSLGTNSRGDWVCNDEANVVLDTCTYTGWGTSSHLSNTDVLGCTYSRCLGVNAFSSNCQGTTFTGYEGASNTSALVWEDNVDTNGKLNDCVFVHGDGSNDCHGLELANQSLTSITLTDVTFSGYSSANGNSNSAIHVKKTTGSLTINITGGTTPTIQTEGAAVSVVAGSVTIAVHAANTTADVASARVFLRAADGTGPFPYQNTVTIVNTGTSANVNHASHGLETNDKVVIDGASHWENNGVFQITVVDTNYYNVTLPSDPGSSPTGSITSTFVALEGLTDGSGDISTSRVYSANQAVTGWIRKSSASPFYKTAILGGEVDSSAGYSATGILILDE